MLVSFLCGAICLIYELVWSRYLTLIFGVSVHAVATVLACFMLGLALGCWHWGKVMDRSRNCVRTLLWLQAVLGCYIALAPLIHHALSAFTIHLFHWLEPEGFFKHAIRFALALLALIVPTFLMGGTLPAIIRIVNASPERVSRDVGILYAVNTLGGAAGAFLTGFFFIAAMGLSQTIFLAAGLNFIIVAVLWLMLRNPVQAGALISRREKKLHSRDRETSEPDQVSAKFVYLTLAVFGLSGFTSLAYEVCWTRILTFFFRDSLYDFAIVLTTFLVGIVIGSFLGGKFIAKRTNAGLWLAGVEILIGVFALLGLFLVARFPHLINHLQTNTALVTRFGEHFWRAGILLRFGYAALLMLIPTILFGATFPLVSRICAGNSPTLGQRIGLMSGVNTLGATLGSVMAGFIFIAAFGIQKSIMLTALLNIAAGLILLTAVPLIPRRLRWSAVAGTGAASLVLVLALPGWDKLRMSTSFLEQSQPLEELLSLEFYQEDAGGVTSVVELKPLQRKYLVSNRLYAQNNSDMMGLEDHRRLGHIPLLLHPHPQSALVIGLGAGITLRAVSDHATTIDCVELSPGVIKAAAFFSAENNRVTENSRVHFIVDDGRSHVSATQKKYDVIVMDILFPMSAGSSTVFSREYFEQCKQRLQPGGLVCQWLPVHQLSLEEIKIIVATFQNVFPHTSLWYGLVGESTGVIGLVGSEQELTIDFGKLAENFRDAATVKELSEVNLGNPALFLSHFIMAGDAVAEFCRGAPLNTDDRPRIEFLAPKLAVQSSRQGVLNLLEFARLVGDVSPHVTNIGDNAAKDSIQTQLKRYTAGKQSIIEGFRQAMEDNPDGQLRTYQDALARDPTNEDLLYTISQLRGN